MGCTYIQHVLDEANNMCFMESKKYDNIFLKKMNVILIVEISVVCKTVKENFIEANCTNYTICLSLSAQSVT